MTLNYTEDQLFMLSGDQASDKMTKNIKIKKKNPKLKVKYNAPNRH